MRFLGHPGLSLFKCATRAQPSRLPPFSPTPSAAAREEGPTEDGESLYTNPPRMRMRVTRVSGAFGGTRGGGGGQEKRHSMHA